MASLHDDNQSDMASTGSEWSRVQLSEDEGVDDDAASVCSSWSHMSAAAFEALQCLRKSDITEVKAFCKPPVGVQVTLQAVCILLGIKPKYVVRPHTLCKEKDYWSVSKALLAAPDFLQRVMSFDPDTIDPETFAQLNAYIGRDDFAVDRMKAVSLAAAGLCMWVHAVHAYRASTIGSWVPPRPAAPDSPPHSERAEARMASDGGRLSLREAPRAPHGALPVMVTKAHIYHLRTLGSPPVGVCDTLNAVLLLLGYDREQIGWSAAQRAMRSPRALLRQLHAFSGDALESRARVRAARAYLEPLRFRAADVQNVSLSAAALADWVQSVVEGRPVRVEALPEWWPAVVAQRELSRAARAVLARVARVRAACACDKPAVLEAALGDACAARAASLPDAWEDLQRRCATDDERDALQTLVLVRAAQEDRWRRARERGCGADAFPFAAFCGGFDPKRPPLRGPGGAALVASITAAEWGLREWGVEHRPRVPHDANREPFALRRVEARFAAGDEAGAASEPEPEVVEVAAAPQELRAWLEAAPLFYDGVVEGEAAWQCVPRDVLHDAEVPEGAPQAVAWALREHTDLTPFYVWEAEEVWQALPEDVIQCDITTPAQDALLSGRARRGAPSAGAVQRRLRRLRAHFAKYGAAAGPAEAFFQPCLRVLAPEDVPAIVARHRAQEEAHRRALEMEGAQFTVFPTSGKWPGTDRWVSATFQLPGDAGRRFAFASPAWRRKMDRLVARRNRLRRRQAPGRCSVSGHSVFAAAAV